MTEYTTLISVPELAVLREEATAAELAIVDCRFDLFDVEKGALDYAAGHIPGAVFADLDRDLAAPVTADSGRHPLPAPDTFSATAQRLGISGGTQVVAYDGGPGGLAARLWWMLRWLGHEQVAVLDGGYAAWQAASMPVSDEDVTPPPGDFAARPRAEWVLDTAELAARLQAGTLPALVDAREAARFRGESEPIDAAAGHIPGATSFPFAQNMTAAGRWREPAELRALWQQHFDGEPPEGWTVMCGSGVTACHLALSAAAAGLPPPRLYAGSWSEWIRDPGRPRAGAGLADPAGL